MSTAAKKVVRACLLYTSSQTGSQERDAGILYQETSEAGRDRKYYRGCGKVICYPGRKGNKDHRQA